MIGKIKLKNFFINILVMAMVFTTLFPLHNVANAENPEDNLLPPGTEVITTDNLTKVSYFEDGKRYTVSVDKLSKKMYMETGLVKYEIVLENIEGDSNEMQGYLINIADGSIINFQDLNQKIDNGNITPYFGFAVPLALPYIAKGIELLLLAGTLIYISGLEYTIPTNIAEITNKYPNHKYHAAWTHLPNGDAKQSIVVIGPGISEAEARARLALGESVFGRTETYAKSIFRTIVRGPEQHGPFPRYLPHYHGEVFDAERGIFVNGNGHSWYMGNIWKN
ncbi:hypothetical protein MHH70_04785 [Metasolibacillus sp. FSL H7-0170]|uniref:hypothetical protein n=1 Tax=Metasolibacillus TaxID=2703677 RepID=UPI000D3526BE|nr:hypothetical protein [Metasolibacillus fluoroglycofenilyticus]